MLDLKRLLRRIARPCSPRGPDDEEFHSASDLSSVYVCEWTPDHIPISRLSVTAQAGSQRTSVRRSWISALARARNIGPARKNKARQPGKRKEPPRPTESMMVAVPSVEAPRTSDGLGESSTLSGGDTPLACSDQPSDLGSIPSWGSSTSKSGSDGSKRFAVRGIVGEGGSGKVFLVRDVMQEQDVAMKVVRVTDSSLPLEYRGVVTEVKILRMLSEAPQKFLLEPYMGCTRRDWLTPFGDLHILTKYYAGGTLEQYLGLLSHREVWLVTAELVLGLNWLHTQGLVHHDLKPANVLVGSDGHCAIADFNSCRQLKDGKLRRRFVFDEVVFTQNYAAPELLPDSNGVEPEYDQSVDIWSLGVVVSELLTGELFGGVNSCTKANVGGSRDDALSHMADAEGACSYLVDLVRGMLSEDPIERMDIAGISKCPGFDQHMGIKWQDVLQKRERAIRTVIPLNAERLPSHSANAAPPERARSHEWRRFRAECGKQDVHFENVDDICV